MAPQSFDSTDSPPSREFSSHKGKRGSKRLVVVLDPRGVVRYERDELFGENIIAVVGERTAASYLSFLRDMGISYLFAGPDGTDLERALTGLATDFGMQTVLLQGGGTVNGVFLNAGLIDELSLLIYPGIDGLGSIASIFQFHGDQNDLPARGQSLELLSTEVLANGLIWARYRFHRPNRS